MRFLWFNSGRFTVLIIVASNMATNEESVSGSDESSGISGDEVSQSTYVFVYILAMVVSAWIFVRYW